MYMSERSKFSGSCSTLLMGSVYLATAFLLFIEEMLLPWDEQGALLAVQSSLLPLKHLRK